MDRPSDMIGIDLAQAGVLDRRNKVVPADKPS